ncbi:MAG: hypothetical protein ABFD92_14000 [Planctomycetaceae bacterium]|nr:hypothetical protein [Planctomycetaceae bacterium]
MPVRMTIPAVAVLVLMAHAAAAQQAYPGDDPRQRAMISQLDKTIAQIDLKDITLKDAVAAIGKTIGVSIRVRWNRIMAKPDAKVCLSLQNVAARDALQLLFENNYAGPVAFDIDAAGNLVVLPADDSAASSVYTRVYDVADLLCGPLSGFGNMSSQPRWGLLGGLSGPYTNNMSPPSTEPAASLYSLELALRPAADIESGGTVVRHASSSSFVMRQPANRHRQVQEVLAGLRGGMARSRLKLGAAVLRVSDGRRRADLTAKLQEARDLEGAINAGRARGDWTIEYLSLAPAYLGQEIAASRGAAAPLAKSDTQRPQAPPATGYKILLRADCWRGECLQFTAACSGTIMGKDGAMRLSNTYRQLLPRQRVRVIDLTPSAAGAGGGFLLALWHDRPPAPPPARAPAAAPTGPTPQSRLARNIAGVDLEKMPFKDAIQWLQDYSGLSIFAHYNQLTIDEDTPVNLHLRNVTVAQALESILEDVAQPRRPPVHVLEGSIVHIRDANWNTAPPSRLAFLDVHDLLVPARPTLIVDQTGDWEASDEGGSSWEGTLMLKLPQQDMEGSQELIAAARAPHEAGALDLGVAVVHFNGTRSRTRLAAALTKGGDIAAALAAGADAQSWRLDRCGIEHTAVNDTILSLCTGSAAYRAVMRPSGRHGGAVEVDIALGASWPDKTGRNAASYTPRVTLQAGQCRLVDITPLDAPVGIALVLWRPKTGDSK